MASAPEPPATCLQVALLIETSLGSGRDILRGIARYVQERGPWALYHEPRSLEEGLPAWLRRWRGHGIIARIQNRALARAVREIGVPTVDVLGVADASFPLVHVDDGAIAQLAADHLQERGFHHFGFIGIRGENWSEHRRDHFRTALGLRSEGFHRFEVARRAMWLTPWEERENALADWIRGLPKPIGLMVCSDQVGPHVLEACRRAGVEVPDGVALVGVDNDETLCEICNPPLSSVDAGHETVGYEAAALLRRLVAGQKAGTKPFRVQPRGVVVRKSSDVLATADAQVAAALRIIREQACQGLMAAEVIRRLPVSRSVLQRRFRRETGRSLQEEIIHVRLERARQLLAETELPLAEIADRSGFKYQEYMGVVFKARLGTSPAEYRRRASRGRTTCPGPPPPSNSPAR